MFLWLKANAATILICIILIAVVAGIVRTILRDKRAGRSSCGCGCADCSACGHCHSKQ